jgi:hypothetical protein
VENQGVGTHQFRALDGVENTTERRGDGEPSSAVMAGKEALLVKEENGIGGGGGGGPARGR